MNSSEAVLLFDRSALVKWAGGMLARAGLSANDADLTATMLVRSDARGFKTHGLARLKSYLDKLGSGEITAGARLSESFTAGAGLVDAGGAIGQVAGAFTVDKAVEHARQTAVVAYRLRDCGHLGAIGLFALRAAEAGMIGMVFQATPPIMGLPGSEGPLIGNNPFALAAPRSGGPPIVVDMACSVAARGNILLAARTGEPIPENWALDKSGEATVDPHAALAGSLLPFAGHKGFAMATIVEILAGSLSGGTFQSSLGSSGRNQGGAGHLNALVIVINPDLMVGREGYERHVASWTGHIRAQGGANTRIPGERAFASEQEAELHGVPLMGSVVAELRHLGDSADQPFPRPLDGDTPTPVGHQSSSSNPTENLAS